MSKYCIVPLLEDVRYRRGINYYWHSKHKYVKLVFFHKYVTTHWIIGIRVLRIFRELGGWKYPNFGFCSGVAYHTDDGELHEKIWKTIREHRELERSSK